MHIKTSSTSFGKTDCKTANLDCKRVSKARESSSRCSTTIPTRREAGSKQMNHRPCKIIARGVLDLQKKSLQQIRSCLLLFRPPPQTACKIIMTISYDMEESNVPDKLNVGNVIFQTLISIFTCTTDLILCTAL